MSDMDLGKVAVKLLDCPTCTATAGQPCRTKSGRKLTDHGHTCHGDRVRPIREVWIDGYIAAEKLATAWRDRARALERELVAVRARVIAALEGKSDD